MKNIIKKEYEINIKNNLIHIINYKNIDYLSINKIIIKIENKLININGTNLMIKCMDEYELLIIGDIKELILNEQ